MRKSTTPKGENRKLKEVGDYLAGDDYRGGARGTKALQKKRASDMLKGTQKGPKVPPKKAKTVAIYETPGTVTKYGKVSRGGIRIKTVGGSNKKAK